MTEKKHLLHTCSIILVCLLSSSILHAGNAREETIQKGLQFIRNGCFEEAESTFKRIVESDRSASEAYFFISFTNFIHLIYNPKNKANRAELEENLKMSIETGERKLQANAADEETQLFLGTSYLLDSYRKALEKDVFSAAFLARKGKKMLENILKRNPERYDACFGLGIYNYYADRVPSIVKGIRFLLFLPGGNSELGLHQLKEASLKSKYFSLEASLILAEIYSNKFEKDYYESYTVLSTLASAENDYLLIAHAFAKLQMKILNFEMAQKILEQSIPKAEATGADEDVLTYMKFHLARCYFRMSRADKALPMLHSLVENRSSCNDTLVEEAVVLTAHSFILTGQSHRIDEVKRICPDIAKPVREILEENRYTDAEIAAYMRNLQALALVGNRSLQALIEALKKNLEQDLSSVQTRLLLGESYLTVNEPELALKQFMEILISHTARQEIKDIAELKSANCMDVMGNRKAAQEIYKRITLQDRSIAREAAYYYQKTPFKREPA